MKTDTYKDLNAGITAGDQPERNGILSQADLAKADRAKLLNRRRQAAFRERRRERLLSLPGDIAPLPADPGAVGKSRGGESRSAQHATKNALDIAIKKWLSKHPGCAECAGGRSRVNRKDQTFVLFTDKRHGYHLVRFMGAVEVSSGKMARDMFDQLRRSSFSKEMKDGRTAYIEDALDVLSKASDEDKRVAFGAKIHHYDRASGYEFGFLLWVGALSRKNHKTVQDVLSDEKLVACVDTLIRISGNPYLNKHNYLTESNLIATACLEYDKLNGNKSRTLKRRFWETTTYLTSFSKVFADINEFAWLRDTAPFDKVLEQEQQRKTLDTEVEHHKALDRSEIVALMSAAIRNGDGNPEGTRTGAATFAIRCSIAVRPSELDRLVPEQFSGLIIASRDNVGKTAEAKSVPDPRASILARVLKHETFMSSKDMQVEFHKLKSGRKSIFEGAFADPKTSAKKLVSYGLRATAVTHLCYIAAVAKDYEYEGKYVCLTKEEIAQRTSHKGPTMIEMVYAQLNGEMRSRPDPRDFYGFSESHGKYIIKLKDDPNEYVVSDYDCLYDCFLLKTWLATWRAVDPEKALHYARLAVEEIKREQSITAKKTYAGKAKVEEF